MIDYDIVIIGGTLAGRYAALYASGFKAKVALVEPSSNYDLSPHHCLLEVSKIAHKLRDAPLFGVGATQWATGEQTSVDWQQAIKWATAVSANLQELDSPAILSARGVDVILGSGEFQRSPDLSFAVGKRLLRARNYLIATGSRPAVPQIEGLLQTGFLTLSNVWQSLSASQMPKNWVIIGGVPQSIEMAQVLTRLGSNVRLIVDSPYLLPDIDPETAQLLQAQLEAEGVRVLTRSLITQVKLITDKKWLQIADKAIETDEILVAKSQQPNTESLNLAAVGVKYNSRRLLVNHKLQTTNPQIYACGDVISGYELINLANYEARIAVKNILFYTKNKINYQYIPWAILTQPMLAQVGLTSTQAEKYGDRLTILRQYFKTLASAQYRDETTGICKIIVRSNGEILGASILGAEAGELIDVIALAIAHKIKVKHLENLSSVYPSFSQIIAQTASEWRKQRLNPRWEEILESFFHFRRDWG